MATKLQASRVFPERGFPLHVIRIPRHGASSLHAHDFTELVMVMGGSGRHVTDTEEYAIEAGDVFVIRGSAAHGYAAPEEMSLVNVVFAPRRLGLPMAGLGDIPGYHVLFRLAPLMRSRSPGRLRLSPSQLAEASTILARIEGELGGRRPGYRFLACAHLMELVGFLSRCYGSARPPESRPLLGIAKVLSFLEQRFGEQIAVRDLARLAGMSESTLTRRFQKILGRAPADYLIRLRVAKAAELLHREDLCVTDVAFRCGFNDSNYFARQFRAVMGLTPRAYRRTTLDHVGCASHGAVGSGLKLQ